MNPTVLATVNQKGGVAKTTSCINILRKEEGDTFITEASTNRFLMNVHPSTHRMIFCCHIMHKEKAGRLISSTS